MKNENNVIVMPNQMTMEQLARLNSLPVYDRETGKKRNKNRGDWLETRWVMMTFALFILTIGVIWILLEQYLVYIDVIDVTALTKVEVFWILGVSYAIGLGYVGGILFEGGIKHHKIAVANGLGRTFWRGGPELIIGLCLIIFSLVYAIGLMVLVLAGIEPYDVAPIDLELVGVIFNIILPITAVIGGILFAKAIRGKDRLAILTRTAPIV